MEARVTPSLTSLVARMATDQAFARQVFEDPGRYQAEYSLSARVVQSLKGLKLDDLKELASFSMPSLTVIPELSGVALQEPLDQDGGGSGCYYGG